MRWSQEKKNMTLQADLYTLIFAGDRPYVLMDDPQGNRLAELFALTAVHPLNNREDMTGVGEWQTEERHDEIHVYRNVQSSFWKSKTIRFICRPDTFRYEVELEGEGHIDEVQYFGGYYSGQIRYGSGFFWSGGSFKQGFNPEPNVQEEWYFSRESGSVIDITGVPLPGKGDWFFTPPPFCFAFEGGNGWFGMGVEASPGDNRFTEYRYNAQKGYYLSLHYEGHTEIHGRTTLPSIGFYFAGDEYEVIDRHTRSLRERKLTAGRKPELKPAWWYSPIFCGWGSQCYEASLEQGHAPDYARQKLYDKFMKVLMEKRVQPGIVVLDDKWQKTYGGNEADEEKWPDLRGFIRERHEEGTKVLLWLKAWDPEGLPAEECIVNAAGLPLAFDPTNPAFEQRLRSSVRNMLSPEGYDADGFKIDFSARIPSGPGIRPHDSIWGLELMKRYLAILHDEAKTTKPDSLIMSHTPHPYLADVLDMIRLNDINVGRDVNRAMTHRARIARSACPDAVIDTDNWPITDKQTWRDFVKLQPELGVPSLYYATHIDSTKEPLTDEDYALIREAWERARHE